MCNYSKTTMLTATPVTYQTALAERLRTRESLQRIRKEDCCDDLAYRRQLVERHLNAYLEYRNGIYVPLGAQPLMHLFSNIVSNIDAEYWVVLRRIETLGGFSKIQTESVMEKMTPLQRTVIINIIAESDLRINEQTIGERRFPGGTESTSDARIYYLWTKVLVNKEELTPAESAYADCLVNCS